MQSVVPKLGFPEFELFLAKGNVSESPEDQGWLRRKGLAIFPDRSKPVGGANDVAGECSARRPSLGCGLGLAVVVHHVRRDDRLVAHAHWQDPVNEEIEPLDEEPTDRTSHHEAESNEVKVAGNRPAPGVRNHELPDPLWVLAHEIQTDGSTPVRHEKRHVVDIEMLEQFSETLRVGFWVVVIRLVAAGRETEPDMVQGDASVLGAQPADEVTELEGPCGIAMYEHDGRT